jgi:hypothetical protein
MKVFSKVQVLAERNGWSIARAQGFIDGEMSRRRGAQPSTYARVGIDDYCLGFRAGYYERGTSHPKAVATPLARPLKNTAAVAQQEGLTDEASAPHALTIQA